MSGYPAVRLLIGGEWKETTKVGDIINPADETTIGTFPHADISDLDSAVKAAVGGFRIWRDYGPNKRAEIMFRVVELVRERADTIAATITLEQGKTLGESELEIARACSILEWEAQEGRRVYGRIIPAEPNMHYHVLRQPIGVVAAFTPWNYPFTSPARKIAAALAAGCSIIIKASEETPGSAVLLAQAFMDAGLPPGVLNLVFGVPSHISEYLIPRPEIRFVTFTGSVPVGKRLAEIAGRHMKPVTMELGGHAPALICRDVDVRNVANVSVLAKSRNAGQVCVAPTRFFVEKPIFDEFVDAAKERAEAIRIGDGFNPVSEMGPLASSRRVDAIERLVADAVDRGARLHSGGARIGNRGFFYPVSVLTDVPDDAIVMNEEPFGPLMLVNQVADLGDAIERANALPYGLSAYAFTRSADNVALLSKNLECGSLSINHYVSSVAETPFGGVKDSGYGREGGIEGLEQYKTVKLVSHLTG
jgi:succinate-semialdehyde dehydrogenase/glutarate-semialdehyde dehydrogenase